MYPFAEYFSEFGYIEVYRNFIIPAGDIVFLKHAVGGSFIIHSSDGIKTREGYEAR